jgi:CubicO group peptidase (beta-lactamase class C family)
MAQEMIYEFDRSRLAKLDKHLASYVDDGKLAGWQCTVARRDGVEHESSYGFRDREAGLPIGADTIFRIASMTKPLTTVTAMTLWEEGAFSLNDPISKWLPGFANARVFEGGTADKYTTREASSPILVWHLMSHSAGLTADFMFRHPVDELYRKAGFAMGGGPAGMNLEAVADVLSGLPLLFEPGTRWGYSLATHVLGRLVEIWSGQALDQAMTERVTGPLQMTDTVWWADASRADRLASVYVPDPATGMALWMDDGGRSLAPPTFFNGGGGLLSTAIDYTRFTRMLMGGGTLDGARILSPNTVSLMTRNHLPGDLSTNDTGGYSESPLIGVGFGLGFAVINDAVAVKDGSSDGSYYWGGAAGTAFWVDPVKDVTVVFLCQLLPTRSLPIREQLRQFVYAALVESP